MAYFVYAITFHLINLLLNETMHPSQKKLSKSSCAISIALHHIIVKIYIYIYIMKVDHGLPVIYCSSKGCYYVYIISLNWNDFYTFVANITCKEPLYIALIW